MRPPQCQPVPALILDNCTSLWSPDRNILEDSFDSLSSCQSCVPAAVVNILQQLLQKLQQVLRMTLLDLKHYKDLDIFMYVLQTSPSW